MKRFLFAVFAVAVALSGICSTDLTDIIKPLQRQRLTAEAKRAPELGTLWYNHAIGSAVVTGLVDKVYTGSGITPSCGVFLERGDKELTNSVDYTASYAAATNAGRYAATFTANKVGYYGSLTLYWNILPADVTTNMIGSISAQSYTGSPVTPEPTISFGGTTLTKGTDYVLTYFDNVKKSSNAIIRVMGKGNFKGYADKYFVIQ